jgi:hypothetical protein
MWRRDRVAVSWLWMVLLAAAVSGCAALGTGVDRTFLQKLDGLKSYQLGFIDQFTAGAGKQWDRTQVDSACAQGDGMFQEATAYAEGKGGDRKAAVTLLYDVFKRSCDVLSRGSLFTPVASAELKEEINSSYADAIRGECSRAPGSPATC